LGQIRQEGIEPAAYVSRPDRSALRLPAEIAVDSAAAQGEVLGDAQDALSLLAPRLNLLP
jgi:hypothetical protein